MNMESSSVEYQRCSCNNISGVTFETDEERSRHNNICPNRLVSCCQNISSCQREIKSWTTSDIQLEACRHQSNGFFGAIRENNIDLVQYFLRTLQNNLIRVFLHETSFGDTILTFAATLGRAKIIEALLNVMQDIVIENSNIVAVTDFVDCETSRGKIAIIEAVKNNHRDIVSILLCHNANAELPSRTHKKSALDWANISRNKIIVDTIRHRFHLERQVNALFNAISKCNMSELKALTAGGAPFEINQEATFHRVLELKRHLVESASQDVDTLTSVIRKEEAAKVLSESNTLLLRDQIMTIQRRHNEIASTRQSEITQALTRLRLDATPDNIIHVCNRELVPPEYELIAKALCTLLHIRPKHHNRSGISNDKSSDDTTVLYWQELKVVMRSKNNSFYHRLRHYHFDPAQVALASAVEIDGMPGTSSDWLNGKENETKERQSPNNELEQDNSVRENDASMLITSISRWLVTIFRSAPGHKLESELVMQESAVREKLENNKIKLTVLTSRCAMLRRELDDIANSLRTNSSLISQLERKIEIGKVMKFVTADGHTPLSWAAAVGNEPIVKELIKKGAHTAFGDDCVGWCAAIIQISFRRFLTRRTFSNIRNPTRERTFHQSQHELLASLRVQSLGRLARKRLRSIRLPLAEAIFNGHGAMASLLDKSDIPSFQAIYISHMFHPPCGMVPRRAQTESIQPSLQTPPCVLISYAIQAGNMFQYDHPQSCTFLASLKSTFSLISDFFINKQKALEKKISSRQVTIFKKHKQSKTFELRSAIAMGDFYGIVRASEIGHIPLDYEDSTTSMTSLIRAAMEDVHSPTHQWCHNEVGEAITAVAYLLDRITLYSPTIDYENRLGQTALTTASSNGRLEAIIALIERGADVNRQSLLNGHTPLMCACLVGKLEVVKLLVKYLADLDLKDSSGCTALDLAIRARHVGVAEYLDVMSGNIVQS